MPAAPIRILAVAALAIAALVGLAVWDGHARATGVEVMLRIERVDPRALLSGHYVAIDTTESLAAGQACPPGAAISDSPPPSRNSADSELWIALARRGDHASAVGASRDRAAAARFAPLLVRGRAYCRPPTAASEGDSQAWPGALTLRLGIDRFYASQAEATRIANLLSPTGPDATAEVSAIVSIGQDGKARLKGLLVQGRRIEPSLL